MGKKSSVTTALLLAIVPAVAIYWLTQGLPGWLSKKPADPPATQMVDGRVIDAGEQRLVSGAAVVLEIGGVNNSDTTDSEGRFLFVLTRAATPLAALLIVRAQGYEAYSLNVALETPELVQDIALQRQAEPPALSNASASRNIVVSSKCLVTICMPTGSPSAVFPHGTLRHGIPARLPVIV